MLNKVTARDVLDAFTYPFSPIAEQIEVCGVSVSIWQDVDAENPYEWGDGMAPAIWIGLGRGYNMQEYGEADLHGFFYHMPPTWVSHHWRKIAAILDLAESDVDSECRETLADYGGHMSNVRQDYFAERLADMRSDSWGYAIDYLEALAALYRLAGIPAQTFQRNGYCQGDSVFGLIVHAPAWCERVGFKGDAAKDMESEADTFGAWCWGDIYGFTVGNDEEGEDMESCGGFYGFDVEHMAGEIAYAVNAILDARATIHAATIAAARPDLAPAY